MYRADEWTTVVAARAPASLGLGPMGQVRRDKTSTTCPVLRGKTMSFQIDISAQKSRPVSARV